MPKACSRWSLLGGQGSWCVGVPPKWLEGTVVSFNGENKSVIQWTLGFPRQYPHLPGWLCQLLRAVLVGWKLQSIPLSHTEVERAWEIPLNSLFLNQLMTSSWAHLWPNRILLWGLRTWDPVVPSRNKGLARFKPYSSSLHAVGWVAPVTPASCFSRAALWSYTFSFVPPLDCLFYFWPRLWLAGP